ncbi:MAG: PLP-dependent aspartate aminotransferase family protein [Gammaproteobacteria bacterium]|nr:PLP-dependent aspartate aminotransferase family protein [Gammaproteobacteria bacterium]
MATKTSQFETRVIHAGETTDSATGAVMPPIVTSTTFEWEALGRPREHIYTRSSNPTRDALERCVAELESGVRGLAYASGQAATAGILDLLDAGSHVIAPLDFYGGTRRLFDQVRRRVSGLEFTFVEMTDAAAVAAAIRPTTKLIWIETPTNPLLKITDIAAVVAIARKHKVLTCVDNTFATPCYQRPLELGVDIVMHSATKYLGGHSDVLGGINVVADAELGKHLHLLRSASGGVLGPFDSYLVLRGIKTLALRMERHCANALAVAQFLEKHPRVSRVYYPGLPAHPQHALAKKQMPGFGGVVCFEIRGDASTVGGFLNRLQVFTVAESLGAVESLAGQPATMSHSSVPADERRTMGISETLVRLSVGIEGLQDLLADLDQALQSP